MTASLTKIERDGVVVYDDSPETEDVRAAVLKGLREKPRRLPSKLFYDERGSELFEEICEQPEYYLTRTELQIMRSAGEEIAKAAGECARVVEFGSGSSLKTGILLGNLREPAAYIPIDISQEPLFAAAAALELTFPDLEILPLCADYSRDMTLPDPSARVGKTIVFFPGSTIGNLERADAVDLLTRMRNIAGSDGLVLVGFDLRKGRATLESAYNDAAGITAKFNLNLLERLQSELDADLDVDGFEHRATYDSDAGRIVMSLRSLQDQVLRVAGEAFEFGAGESMTTEYCHKYTREGVAELGENAGLEVLQIFTDDQDRFAVVMFSPARAGS